MRGTTWLLLGLLAIGSAPGCKGRADAAVPAEQNAGPRTVSFDPAALERLGIRVEAAGSTGHGHALRVTGTLEYNLEHYGEIGALLEGRVTTINVRVGEKVKKGQLLGTVMVPSIAHAQAQYVSAFAAAQIAKQNAEREHGLLEKQLTTAREAEVAKSEAVRTESEVKAAAAKLQVLGVGLPASGAGIQSAGTLRLVAPLDGVVVRRDAVLGRYLQPNETAFVVADPTQLWASLDVYESDLAYFQKDAVVELTLDALPGKVVKGTVFIVEPQLGKESRMLRARIAVPNTDSELKPGLFVRARLELPEQKTVEKLYVPTGAVQPLGDGDYAFVELEPGKYEVRKVTADRHGPQVIEVTSGLKKGERIVVDGAFLLRGEATKQ